MIDTAAMDRIRNGETVTLAVPRLAHKTLTVQQPWAWAIIHGQKRCENRTWATNYRGPLLIHAGKSRDAVDEYNTDHVGLDDDDRLAFGAIIGIVDLVDCVELANVGPDHDDYAVGPWCWILANPRPVEVTVCKGVLGLWEYRGEIRELTPARTVTQG